MTIESLPRLIEPADLEPLLGSHGLQLVSLCKDSTYSQLHIPGAVHLAYARITASRGMTHGLLPVPTQLERVLSDHGIGNDSWVVAYDDEGGGNASRLLWTLEALGHTRYSLLNGGLHAWANEGHPLSREPTRPAPASFHSRSNPGPVADGQYILQHLGNADLALWDARSLNEYRGISRFAQFAGHIPGAVNLDWFEVMDREHNLRLKPAEQLREMLTQLHLTPDKEIVTYCQTHHRSSLAWFVLSYLDYPRVKGYPGSWSDWGNRADTPKETTG
jgi:thiosulfate/3-mercaptopyruvate sulfurtransferase